jgi:GNAT superfamily N-acetyltransferase
MRLHQIGDSGALIRPAGPADADAIARVQVDTWRAAYRGVVPDAALDSLNHEALADRHLRIIANPKIRSFVADMDSIVIGYAQCGPARDAEWASHGEIYAIYVDPTRWRGGTGRCLMTAAADALIDAGYSRTMLWALRDNPWRGFYDGLGGTIAAEAAFDIGGRLLPHVAYVWDTAAIGDQRSGLGATMDPDFIASTKAAALRA